MLERWRQLAGDNWQTVMRERLDIHRRSYEGDRPADAWAAFLVSRMLGETPPDWVMEYLATCAGEIYSLETASIAGEIITPNRIAGALGMVTKGPGTAFTDQKEWDWLGMALDVRELIRAGDKDTYAIAAVSADYKKLGYKNASPSTVRKAWKRYQATCPEG